MKFCEQLLKLSGSTPNCIIRGELGRYLLVKSVELRMVSFWHRLITGGDHKLSFMMYKLMRCLHEHNIYSAKWILRIKHILDSSGMSNVWDNPQNVNFAYLKSSLSSRLSDIHEQGWRDEIFQHSHCRNYRIFKSRLLLENYLSKLPTRDALQLCKFRCGNSKIPAVTGRFYNINFEDRVCQLCTRREIGDEFHYLFCCDTFKTPRQQYLNRYYRVNPNTLKMHDLFNTTSKKVRRNLALLCSAIVLYFSND